MPRRNYPRTKRQTQRSKRARLHRHEAHFARMRPLAAHPSHIAFRWNRMGDYVYRRLLERRIKRMQERFSC